MESDIYDCLILLVRLVYYSISEDLILLPLLFLYFSSSCSFFIISISSQNQRIDGSWVCYEQFGGIVQF